MSINIPIILLSVGQTLVWACLYYVFPALILRWEETIGWNKVEISLAITLALLTSAVFSPIAGKIIDKGKGHFLLFFSALLGGLELLFLASISSIWQFYLIWILLGISMSGCLYEACFSFVTKCRGSKAKRDIISITLISGFASTICFPSTYFISNCYGWQTTIAIFGLVVIFLAAPILLIGAVILKRNPESTLMKNQPDNKLTSINIKNPLLISLGISFALLALIHGSTINHLLPILSERGYSSNLAILAAACLGPTQILGRVIMLFSEKYISTQKFSIFILPGMTLSLIVLYFSQSSTLKLIIFIIIFGTSYGTISILRPVMTRILLGEKHFGLKSGYLGGAYLIGTAAAPSFGAVIWKLFNYQGLIVILFIVGLISWFMYLKANQIFYKNDKIIELFKNTRT